MDRLYLCNGSNPACSEHCFRDNCIRTTHRRYSKPSNMRVFVRYGIGGFMVEVEPTAAAIAEQRRFFECWGRFDSHNSEHVPDYAGQNR